MARSSRNRRPSAISDSAKECAEHCKSETTEPGTRTIFPNTSVSGGKPRCLLHWFLVCVATINAASNFAMSSMASSVSIFDKICSRIWPCLSMWEFCQWPSVAMTLPLILDLWRKSWNSSEVNSVAPSMHKIAGGPAHNIHPTFRALMALVAVRDIDTTAVWYMVWWSRKW